MGYVINTKNGKIHTDNESCARKMGNSKSTLKFKTLIEAKATAKAYKKKPSLCRKCHFENEVRREFEI